MTKNDTINELPIIEVPLELRGLSDAEILVLSESRVKEGVRRGFRPSKSERTRLRQEKSRQKLLEVEKRIEKEKSAHYSTQKSFFRPMPKVRDFEFSSTSERVPTFKTEVPSVKKYASASLADLFNKTTKPVPETFEKKEVVVRSSISSSPKPTSGRVLQAKFSFPGAKKTETTIVSARELEEQRVKERELKIKKAANKKQETLSPDGTLVKRPRGRPRKNPLPSAEV